MRVTVVAVHPTVTILSYDGGQFELPTTWFSSAPTVGQAWDLALTHQPTADEQLERLNDYLIRD